MVFDAPGKKKKKSTSPTNPISTLTQTLIFCSPIQQIAPINAGVYKFLYPLGGGRNQKPNRRGRKRGRKREKKRGKLKENGKKKEKEKGKGNSGKKGSVRKGER